MPHDNANPDQTTPAPGTTPTGPRLAKVLSVEPCDPDRDVFTGVTSPQPHGRVFGGQELAQALLAAAHTVDTNRPVHSMHAYFLRPGTLTDPLTFDVERLRDGRSFSARRIQVIQNDRPILSAIASFQAPGTGPDHSLTAPEVPEPESLPSTADLMAGVNHPVAQFWARERPIDIRHIDQPIYFGPAANRTDQQLMWLKPLDTIPDAPTSHQAALAYASDFTLLESILRKNGMSWATPGLKGASLDHAMHWHRPFTFTDWVLCVQTSPSAFGARGLARAEFFTKSGIHIASVCQELMIRVQ